MVFDLALYLRQQLTLRYCIGVCNGKHFSFLDEIPLLLLRFSQSEGCTLETLGFLHVVCLLGILSSFHLKLFCEAL